MPQLAFLVPHLLALAWAAGGGFLAWKQLTDSGLGPGMPGLLQVGFLAGAGLLIGYLSAFLLTRLTRRFGLTAAGSAAGYCLLAPPAINLGLWAGYLAQSLVPSTALGLPLAFVPAAVLAATAILLAGATAGLLLERLAVALARRIPVPMAVRQLRLTPRVRITVLSGVLAAVSVYAWQERYQISAKFGLPWPEDAPRASAWMEREKHLYQEMLAGSRHDLLVVPMQAQGRSVDRVSRSLMTRLLVQAAEQRTGKPLPDPTWVSRAFGASMRTVTDDEIQRLAEAMGAKRVLVSRVGLEEGRLAMRFEFEVRERQPNGWQTTARPSIPSVSFSDELPPAEAFRSSAEAIVHGLPGTEAQKQSRPAPSRLAGQLPEDPASLFASAPASPVESALRLQLVASLHDRESVEGEQLFERSLMALGQATPDDPLASLLVARAYFHLHHRPYAAKLASRLESPEAQAFMGILQGNLPQAEKSVEAIDNEALQVVARIEAEDLRTDYGKMDGFEKRRDRILRAFPAYEALFGLRLSAGDWFSPEATGTVMEALGRLGVPASSPTLQSRLAQAWIFAKALYFVHDEIGAEIMPVAMVEAAYPDAMRGQAGSPGGADQLARWDYFDLLFAINRSAYLKSISSTIFKQVLPERTLAMADAASDIFSGHPRLAYMEAWALNKLADQASERQRNRLLDRRSRLARDAYHWEGGETSQGIWLEWAIWPRPYEKYLDEPLRPDRGWHKATQLEFHEDSLPPKEMVRRVAELVRKLNYTQTNFRLVTETERLLHRLGHPETFASVQAAIAGRFVGSPERSRYLAKRLERTGERAERKSMLQELIQEEPDEWLHYFLLGKAYGEERDYGAAQKVFLSYPAFSAGEANPVHLSNEAATFGGWLYDHGETGLSCPLFRLAASYRTGSGSEMLSAELLAVMDGNGQEAAKQARRSIDRYNDSGAASRYTSYLFFAGKNKEAWAAFEQLQPRFEDEKVWWAALNGHRIAATDNATLKDWLLAREGNDRHRHYLSRALRERFGFIALTMDRAPTAETVEWLQQVTDRNNDSFYYPTIARGYLALRQGNFKSAIAALEPIGETLTNISVERRQTLNDMLPYLAYAYGKSGQGPAFEGKLAKYADKVGEDFDYLLAQAVLHGLAGRHDKAIETLDTAYARFPPTSTRSFVPVYQLLELSEWLLRDTGHAPYRNRLLDWARRMQKSFPNSWAYSFDAKHAELQDDRIRALGMTLYLDPGSERIRGLSDKDIAAGRAWIARNNPFLAQAGGK